MRETSYPLLKREVYTLLNLKSSTKRYETRVPFFTRPLSSSLSLTLQFNLSEESYSRKKEKCKKRGQKDHFFIFRERAIKVRMKEIFGLLYSKCIFFSEMEENLFLIFLNRIRVVKSLEIG